MALLHMNFYSPSMKYGTNLNIVIPTPRSTEVRMGTDGYFHEGCKFQVLYLLHGTGGDYSDWVRRTSLERYAEANKLIVVMPSGANSCYQDMVIGQDYFTYITEELPRFMKVLFPVSDAREDTFIGGLSMGAYGAMNIAIRRPDLYSKAIALSGALSFREQTKGEGAQAWPWEAILPPPFDGVGHPIDDIPILKQKVADGVEMPDFYMAIGTEDFLYDRVQPVRELMESLDINYTYEESPGHAHEWDFWDMYIKRAIEWIKPKGTSID